MSESITRDKAVDFAIRIARLYSVIKARGEYVLSKQMLKSGTAIGALLMEAEHAQSTADFINKVNIALKEANETKYRLLLLYKSDFLNETEYNSILSDCSELIRLTASIVKTTRKRQSETK